MTWDDQELARFSSGLRRRYHVWYEQDERATLSTRISQAVCVAVVVFWAVWVLA